MDCKFDLNPKLRCSTGQIISEPLDFLPEFNREFWGHVCIQLDPITIYADGCRKRYLGKAGLQGEAGVWVTWICELWIVKIRYFKRMGYGQILSTAKTEFLNLWPDNCQIQVTYELRQISLFKNAVYSFFELKL